MLTKRANRGWPLGLIAALACGALLGGCATVPRDPAARAEFKAQHDPLEPLNRRIFAFNLFVDRKALKPIFDYFADAARGDARLVREQIAIGWAFTEADAARTIYARLLNGEIPWHWVNAPDMGSWDTDDPRPQALEHAADVALERAKEARKRLAEYQQREAAGMTGERVA